MQSLGIVLMCVVAAVCYGIAHDQVTARVCVEYFTVGHSPVFGTDDPTLLAIGWGLIATWWVGLLLGVALALVARAGSRPKRSVGSLVRPVAWLLAVMSACALGAGFLGWLLASSGAVFLVGPIARELPADRHVAFLADLWAHSASYLIGLIGGIVVMVLVWRARGRTAATPDGEPGTVPDPAHISARHQRDFAARSAEEREWMLQNTWCGACGEAALGMSSPHEYAENGRVYVEGQCRKCGQVVRSEVTEEEAG